MSMAKNGKMEERKCVICGETFTRHRAHQLCCSKVCSKIRNRKMAALRGQRKRVPKDAPKAKKESVAKDSKKVASKRRCHDCGEPTPNYRCADCLRKWREKHHVSSNAEEVSEVGLFI